MEWVKENDLKPPGGLNLLTIHSTKNEVFYERFLQ